MLNRLIDFLWINREKVILQAMTCWLTCFLLGNWSWGNWFALWVGSIIAIPIYEKISRWWKNRMMEDHG